MEIPLPNDSVFLLANGRSGVACPNAPRREMFAYALDQVCIELAKKMPKMERAPASFWRYAWMALVRTRSPSAWR